jgi:hypothetical protein
MPQKRISFSSFQRRLVLAGGREQTGPAALRRASGVAVEATTSVLSRWGSNLLYGGITAIQVYYWNGARYAYDGTKLYRNGLSILTGFNGGRLSFNSAPPQPGLNDYLFILGGGITPFKIDPSGNITNWGIVAPPNQMQVNNNPLLADGPPGYGADQTIIDQLNSSGDIGNWTANANCSKSFETTEIPPYSGATGAMKVPTTLSSNGSPWRVVNSTSFAGGEPPGNLGTFQNGDISLQTDVIQFWLLIDTAGNAGWIEIDFDVNDGTFGKDYYHYAIQLISSNSSNPNAGVVHATQESISFQPQQWQQITIAKSQFLRTGLELQLDWANIQAVRFQGGYFVSTTTFFLGGLTLSGGCALGAGPAVGAGGSEYDYYTVFRNLVTGSQSNPQETAARVFGVQDNSVQATQIPVSSDSQVGARDLYRSQAGGGNAFYLDTIYDNTTTTYRDVYSDTSFRVATTPWQQSVAVPPNAGAPYYIDSGNGYYFKNTTPGTTGSQPPVWKIPTAQWSAQGDFEVGETVAPLKGAGNFFQVTTAGISGLTEPNWAAALALSATVTDGTVVWTNIGIMTTTDNTAVWTFEGINSTPTLSDIALLLDNAPPQSTYGWAFGLFGASMFWTMDSAAGRQGYYYFSPPGRPESVAQAVSLTGSDDPMQAILEYDGVLWAFSQQQAFQTSLGAAYPAYSFAPLEGAPGTTQPFTATSIETLGIVHWTHDGMRVLNWGGSRLFAFTQLATILRGQTEEDVPAWSYLNPPVWATAIKDEILISDGKTLTLAISYDGLAQGELNWRLPGPIMTAAYYDLQTGEVQACFTGNIYQFEVPGTFTDGPNPIAFELQSPGDMPDVGAEFTTQRLYLTFNAPKGQKVTPTLIVDGTEIVLPVLTGKGKRFTYEMSPKYFARLFDGIRLNANLTGRLEVFRLEADVWLGEQQMAANQ